MNYDIKKESDRSYFVVGFDDDRDCYEKKMILQNEITGFLNVRLENIGSTVFGTRDCDKDGITGNGCGKNTNLMYEITGRESMTQKYPYQSFGLSDAIQLLDAISDVMDQVTEYMLDPQSLILVPEVIFYRSDEPGFCYLPMFHQDLNKAFRNLMSFMISHADYNEPKSVKGIYEINSYIVRDDFSITGLRQFLKGFRHNGSREEAVVEDPSIDDTGQFEDGRFTNGEYLDDNRYFYDESLRSNGHFYAEPLRSKGHLCEEQAGFKNGEKASGGRAARQNRGRLRRKDMTYGGGTIYLNRNSDQYDDTPTDSMANYKEHDKTGYKDMTNDRGNANKDYGLYNEDDTLVSSRYVNADRDRQIRQAADAFYDQGCSNDDVRTFDNNGNRIKIKAALTIGAFIGILAGFILFILRSGPDIYRIAASFLICTLLCIYALEKQLHFIRDTKKKLANLRDYGVNVDDFTI